jgi:hypothetical protein
VTEWLSTHRKARVALLVGAGATIGLLLLAFVLVGVDRAAGDGQADAGPNTPVAPTAVDESRPSAPMSSAQPSPEAEDPVSDDQPIAALPTLPDTSDPDAYAAAVAEALFGMDYTTFGPEDYELLLTDALWPEIVPEDRSRIVATVSRRIPTPNMWEQMRSIQQTAEFDVGLVWEPRAGRQGREERWWPDGVVLRNVSGTQTETWRASDGSTQNSTREVAVTVGVACAPPTSLCRLLSIQPNVES